MAVNVILDGHSCPLCGSEINRKIISLFDHPALIIWTCGNKSDPDFLYRGKQPLECRIRQLERELIHHLTSPYIIRQMNQKEKIVNVPNA